MVLTSTMPGENAGTRISIGDYQGQRDRYADDHVYGANGALGGAGGGTLLTALLGAASGVDIGQLLGQAAASPARSSLPLSALSINRATRKWRRYLYLASVGSNSAVRALR